MPAAKAKKLTTGFFNSPTNCVLIALKPAVKLVKNASDIISNFMNCPRTGILDMKLNAFAKAEAFKLIFTNLSFSLANISSVSFKYFNAIAKASCSFTANFNLFLASFVILNLLSNTLLLISSIDVS